MSVIRCMILLTTNDRNIMLRVKAMTHKVIFPECRPACWGGAPPTQVMNIFWLYDASDAPMSWFGKFLCFGGDMRGQSWKFPHTNTACRKSWCFLHKSKIGPSWWCSSETSTHSLLMKHGQSCTLVTKWRSWMHVSSCIDLWHLCFARASSAGLLSQSGKAHFRSEANFSACGCLIPWCEHVLERSVPKLQNETLDPGFWHLVQKLSAENSGFWAILGRLANLALEARHAMMQWNFHKLDQPKLFSYSMGPQPCLRFAEIPGGWWAVPCQTFLDRRHFEVFGKMPNGFFHNSATVGRIPWSKVVLESPNHALSDETMHHGNMPRPGAAFWKNCDFAKMTPNFTNPQNRDRGTPSADRCA